VAALLGRGWGRRRAGGGGGGGAQAGAARGSGVEVGGDGLMDEGR
jgi:hypothetical protein